ncbi:hypothetical protein M899_2311 [Bacteriovorax sp. BSW11_IV]|uniref:hypothetical protein n=1 Tax=Bacteriovorax sp. BSW11_IV TaxID=1353529 RepID=UPI00038A0C0B|nr:hypothetical protein [Bacteriovorax sp. BSW11_IV]EQC44626.1 hypothetical protein M899_2311 [Bacteriovorax sp. BSW11_IV]
MKTLFVLIAFAAMTQTQAFSCKQYEAQVIGKVISKTIDENGECALRVSLWQVNEHIMCPLSKGEIESTEITGSYSCSFESGDDFSGIVVNDGKTTFLD